MPVTPTLTAHDTNSLTFDAPASGLSGTVTRQWFLRPGPDPFTPAPVHVGLEGGDTEFSPSTLTFGAGNPPPAQTSIPTPATAGTKSISVTNDSGLTNPAAFSFVASAVGGLCTVSVRVRDGSGDLVNGCTFTAELVSPDLHTTDAVLTDQVESAVTGAGDWPDGHAELALYAAASILPAQADRRYRLRVLDPQGRQAAEKYVEIPDTDTADFWEL